MPHVRVTVMTLTALLSAVCWELTLAARPHSVADVQAFLEVSRPLAERDPDPARWAKEYVEWEAGLYALKPSP
jgi:hypothetical protein